jgi:5,10-methylenetetrahydromethanopterin reductase
MLELAGRIADGVILNLMSPAQARRAASLVRAAAVAAGRDASAVEICCVVHTCVSDDANAAATAAREGVPRYVLHPAVGRLFADHDADADLAAARERALSGARAGATLHVPQHVADAFVASGPAGACLSMLAEYRAASIDLPVVFPMPVAGDWGYERAIAALTVQAVR